MSEKDPHWPEYPTDLDCKGEYEGGGYDLPGHCVTCNESYYEPNLHDYCETCCDCIAASEAAGGE